MLLIYWNVENAQPTRIHVLKTNCSLSPTASQLSRFFQLGVGLMHLVSFLAGMDWLDLV